VGGNLRAGTCRTQATVGRQRCEENIVHKRMRKHSALLLFMAPIIAIGSSALVAGSAGTAGATVKKANPTITIVDAVPGAFRFSVNGSIVSLKNQRGVFAGKVGVNLVSEVSAPALFRTLSSISVSPPAARVSSSLKAGTVTLKLAAGRAAIVRFVNSKLVVTVTSAPVTPVAPAPVAPAPAAPAPAAPAPGAPAPGAPAPVAPAPVSSPPPVVTNPTSPPSAGDGYIEVCKTAGDAMVEGTFSFTITSGTTIIPVKLTPVYTVEGDSSACTGSIAVTAGTVTVSEQSYLGYELASVTSYPATAVVGTVNLTAQSANFTVTLGLETTADFTDVTATNTIKVCKVLANNLGNLGNPADPTTFNFGVSWMFTPLTPNPSLTPVSFSGPSDITVGVVAVPAPGEACTVVPYSIPVGAVVHVWEAGSVPVSYTQETDVSIVPSQFAVTPPPLPLTDAFLTVPPNNNETGAGDGLADAVFTDTPMGFIEVCKYFDPSWLLGNPQGYDNGHNVANFTVSSVSTGFPFPVTSHTVAGGTCTDGIEVPAGTGLTTITETAAADYQFEYVTAEASVAGVSYDELTGLPLAPRAQPSESTVNPAVVSVPYGGTTNDTSVKFWDAVDPIQIKICAKDTSVDTPPVNETIWFKYTQTDSISEVLPVSVTTGADFSCAWVPVTADEYVVNSLGVPYVATVTEYAITTPSAPGVGVTSIAYNGLPASIVSSTTGVLPAYISFTVGLGNNEVDFTNGPLAT
jgi:hypothetical protein